MDASGSTGKLVFPGTPPLDLKFRVTEGSPAALTISAVMKLPDGKSFTNELHGWFVPARLEKEVSPSNPLVVRGSIVQTSVDIHPTDPQPIGTIGFFVLEPMA